LADPVTELTVSATPAALQSGAAQAVGAAIVLAVRPAKRQQPAACRRAVLALKFIIVCILEIALRLQVAETQCPRYAKVRGHEATEPIVGEAFQAPDVNWIANQPTLDK
jgi:hypothetical protein